MPLDSNALHQRLLVVRSQLGDRAALAELVELWQRRILYYVRRLLSSEPDAQQVAQEVWAKALASLANLEDPAKWPPWIYSIARRTVIDHLRDSYTRRRLLDAVEHELPAAADESPIEQFENAELVHYGLSQLDVVDREVLTLYFLDDLSVHETAEVLQIPTGTVKSRLYHARQALTAVLNAGARPQ